MPKVVKKIDTEKEKKEKIDRAKLFLSAEMQNSVVMESMAGKLNKEFELLNFLGQTSRVGIDVNNGDMAEIERMLVSQAYALQTMFMSLVNKAQAQEYLKQYTTHMQLALKAQAQSRATIQALTELKYPRQVIVAQQANIANQQQVNNGVQAPLVGKEETKTIEVSHADQMQTLNPKLRAQQKTKV
ncbi:MAG: hypothetical protein ACRCWR_04960 [Saezia sp.]